MPPLLPGHAEAVRFLLDACRVNPAPKDRWAHLEAPVIWAFTPAPFSSSSQVGQHAARRSHSLLSPRRGWHPAAVSGNVQPPCCRRLRAERGEEPGYILLRADGWRLHLKDGRKSPPLSRYTSKVFEQIKVQFISTKLPPVKHIIHLVS